MVMHDNTARQLNAFENGVRDSNLRLLRKPRSLPTLGEGGVSLICLDQYPIFAGSKQYETVRSKDHLIFSARDFLLNEWAWDCYQDNLLAYAKTTTSDKTRLFLMAHLQALKDALDTERTYTGIPGGVLVDEKNELELIGVPQYAKRYQVIYDFSKHLDVVLTYLCGIPYNELCDRLEKNLSRFNLDYDVLSTAIMTDNVHLLKYVPIGVLFGLSDGLDRYLQQGLQRKERCTLRIRGELVPLPSDKWNEAELMYFLIGIQVWEVLQYVFEEFVKLYNQNLLLDPKIPHSITSKGHSNVVIQSEDYTEAKPLAISFNDMSFLIEPIVCQRGQYFKTFE